MKKSMKLKFLQKPSAHHTPTASTQKYKEVDMPSSCRIIA